MKLINDTLKNPDSTWSSLKIMRNLCFGVGLLLAIVAPNPESRWLTLVLLGLGTHGVKSMDTWFARRTADGNGNPMIQEGTAVAPKIPVIPTADAQPATAQEVVTATNETEVDSR